jgi:FimV-like protein
MTWLIHFIQTHSYVVVELPLLISIVVIAKVILLKRVHETERQHARSMPEIQEKKDVTVITSQDIKAIAGDDVMVTQLDLARAYIELDKKALAKQILQHVLQHGSQDQREVAQQLVASLS